jgi:hypothetical protein
MISVRICKNKLKLLLIDVDSIKIKNNMKKHYSILMTILCAVFSVMSLYAQGNDDLYFDGVETSRKKEIVIESPEINDEIMSMSTPPGFVVSMNRQEDSAITAITTPIIIGTILLCLARTFM